MTIIAYRPLALVSARTKGKAASLVSVGFTPTPSTVERMNRQRIAFRGFPGGFRLAAQHDAEAGGGPLVPISGDLPLLFAITVGEGVAAGDEKLGPAIFLSNRNNSGTPQGGPQLGREEMVGAKDRAWIVPRRHVATMGFGAGARPKNIEVRPAFGGAAIETISVDAPPDSSAFGFPVELSDREELAFILKPKPSGTDRLLIADDELASMRAGGALELVLRTFPGPAPAEGREFIATFAQ